MRIVEVESLNSDFQEKLTIGKHTYILDAEVEKGGGDVGPSPHDLLTASLLACKSMTLRMYAKRKGWDLTGLKLTGEQVQIDRHQTQFKVTIFFPPHLDQESRDRLVEISKKCPVHRTLEGKVEIQSEQQELTL